MKKFLSIMLAFVLALSLAACGGSAAAESWQEQYDLGVKYLSELNYEEAVVAFTKAIEIDPKQAEAYVELARVYVQQENKDEAKKVLYKASSTIGENEKLDNAYSELEIEKPSDNEETADNTSPQTPVPFDESKIVKSERYDYNDGSYYIEDYDENGNNIRTTEYNADGSVDYWYISDYDEKGNCTRTTVYNADGSVESIWDYDEDGNCIRETWYNADGSVDYWYIYDYDEKGNQIRSTYYNADGSVDYWYIYDYDENGNTIRTTEYNADGSVAWVEEY